MAEREILFRGKLKDKDEWIGEWIEGIYCPCSWDLYMRRVEKPRIIILSNKGKTDGLWREVIPETVGQYTGLTDKNGKKIFEGDIVRYDVNYHDMVISYDVENWDGWLYEDIDDNMHVYSICEFCLKDIEVIGNIHDNTNMLKEASKPIAQDVLASATDEGKEYIAGFRLMQG